MMKKRVTVFAVHANHPLAALSKCRFPDIGLRTAVHAACLGHDVSLIVFRGSQALVVPDKDSFGDAPYHAALECVARVNEFRAAHASSDDIDPTQDDSLNQAPLGEPGSLSIEYVAPPPVVHMNAKYRQDWSVPLLAALPPESDCVIDASGPDLLNISHVDGHRRADAYAAVELAQTERQALLAETAPEADQWTQGRMEFPSVQTIVATIAQHAQAISAMNAFLLHASECLGEEVAEMRKDVRRQDREQNLADEHVMKVWMLNDWRALDLSPLQRVPTVTVKGFNGGTKEGSVGAAAAAGIQHYVKRTWHYSQDIGDWSMLCVPPLLGPKHDVTIADVAAPEELFEGTRSAGRFRISTSEAPVDAMPYLSVLPPRLLAPIVFSRLLRARPTVDDVAHFLTQNMESRKYGLGETLSNAEIIQRSTGDAPLAPEEISRAKQEQASKDRTATVFPTLEGLSTFRFVRRRVGLARYPAQRLTVGSILSHAKEVQSELSSYALDRQLYDR